jgi:hypothetical protein
MPNIIGPAKESLRESAALVGRLDKNFSDAQGQLGQAVNIGVRADLAAAAITPTNIAAAGTDKTIGARTLTIDKFYGSTPFALNGQASQNYDIGSTMQEQIKEAVRRVVYQVSADTWALYKKIPGIAGTATQSLFNNGTAASIDTLADVYKQLGTQLVDPAYFDLVMSTTDEAAAKKVGAMQLANQRGDQSVMVDGSVGRTQGFNIFVDHQVPKHTVGSITGALIAKASTAQAVGTTSLVVTTAASTGAFSLKAGDSLTIGSDVYVVASDIAEASAATDETITLTYGLKTALAGSEAVTLTTGLGTCYQDIAGDLRGIGCVARMPATEILRVMRPDRVAITRGVMAHASMRHSSGERHRERRGAASKTRASISTPGSTSATRTSASRRGATGMRTSGRPSSPRTPAIVTVTRTQFQRRQSRGSTMPTACTLSDGMVRVRVERSPRRMRSPSRVRSTRKP